MNTENTMLREKCEQTKAALAAALDWIEHTSNEGAANNAGLTKDLRKSIVRAGKLAKAADRKMCVGVYGASQAGKSYLISTLARSSDKPLLARFGNQTVDFIKHINPEGGGESTGLVTRFTMDQQTSSSENHPIHAALLSEIDLIKIFANSFVHDIKHDDEIDVGPFEEEIAKRLSSLEGSVGQASHFTLEDVYDLEDYCNKKLIRNPYFQALKRSGYWDACAELAPSLASHQRQRLFGLLWQDMPIFSDLYATLNAALEKINYAQEVFCSPLALFLDQDGIWVRDQDKSIINVSGLHGLGTSSDDTISVVTKTGQSAQISRADIGALVAELTISMDHQPHDFFEHTDLLDFPGARTRSENANDREQLALPEKIAGIFLRGKVDYLFDRYSDEQELTSMLLCVGESNQEVAEVPLVVEEWVSQTHGATPEQRASIPTSLFFIMTKFDTSFAHGAGKSIDSSRWKTRMEYSLIKAFQEKSPKTKWVQEWHPNTPFNNLFWIRNPYYLQENLFQYDSLDPIVEKDLRDDKKDFVNQIYNAYLECEEVTQYFSDPTKAFNAAMTLNDGGVSYLIEQLKPICNPDLKNTQVKKNIGSLVHRALLSLSPYFTDSDLDALAEKKKKEAAAIVRNLGNCLKIRKMGEFLNYLRLPEEEAYSIFVGSERLANKIITGTKKESDKDVSSVQVSALGDDINALLGLDDEPAEQLEEAAGVRQPMDLAAKFSSDIETNWMEKMRDLASDEAALHYYGLTDETVLNICSELMMAAHGNGLFDKMSDLVRTAQRHKVENQESFRWKQVAPACGMFNEYISTIGMGGVFAPSGSDILDLRDAPVTVFKANSGGGVELLTEQGSDFYNLRFADWIKSVQFMIRENAKIQAGIVGDSEDNSKLGRVIERLETVSAGG